ncbi:MAG: hypothetical protein WD398_03870 [Cyclobacteriaceae bacterium]
MKKLLDERFLWVFLLPGSVIFLFSCKEETKLPYANPTQIDAYFSTTEFLEKEIEEVSGEPVKKIISINEEQESVEFSPTAEEWRKELDVFFQADINKAALSNAYQTQESDSLLIHSLKPGEDANIKEMKIVKKGGKVLSLEIVSLKNNFFYRSEMTGKINMGNQLGKIRGYSLKGRQKVWFLPENRMELNAVVGTLEE